MRTTMQSDLPSATDLAGFRRAQRTAYDAATEVAANLVEGVTEKEAARKLGAVLGARGVRQYFHQPFAWFGDRTRLAGFGGLSPKFMPTRRRLEQGMVAILDVAPVVNGYVADIGYTFFVGEPDAEFKRAQATLLDVRAMIPARVAKGDTMRSVYLRVEGLLRDRGYDECHTRYPFRVLGHRVNRIRSRRHEPKIAGFGLSALRSLLAAELLSHLPGAAGLTPLWNDSPLSNQPLKPGLWAIEPHLGAAGFGAKFEELLVVGHHRAHWLDDSPHWSAERSPRIPGPSSVSCER
jgi:Xaa-Pro aminopeptidase